MFKNRITARTSHLAGAAGAESGSSISNGCRAKNERLSGLSDSLFGSGGTNKHSSVANSHANSFPAAPALWRPYFWDHPRSICKLYNNMQSHTITVHKITYQYLFILHDTMLKGHLEVNTTLQQWITTEGGNSATFATSSSHFNHLLRFKIFFKK